MTGGPAGETPWWEFDPAEKPVPLGAEDEWGLADDAELIVNSERETMTRQDTEPTLQTLAAIKAAAAHAWSGREGNAPISSRSGVALAVALLLAGAVTMFALGWSQGVAARNAREQAASTRSAEVSGGQHSGVNRATLGTPSARFTWGLPVDGFQGAKDKEVSRR